MSPDDVTPAASDDPARAASARSGSEAEPAARRFVALPIPSEVRAGLETGLPDVDRLRQGRRWTRPDGWHLTVAFLGRVPDARLDALTTAVGAGVAEAPVPDRLQVGTAGRFGRKVLWVAIGDEPEGSLRRLAEAVRDAVGGAGFEVDRKPFRAHLTLARAGRRDIRDRLVTACTPPEGLSWRPTAVEVWRSELGSGPARYVSEASITLPR